MRGKYSPTVQAAYVADQDWWTNYAYTGKHNRERDYVEFDPEGYDSYGYDANGFDRAGWQDYVYASNDSFDEDDDYNNRYDRLCVDWTFDGTKPVRRA